ncbi:MAG: hypothetical protein FJZ96_11500 [Chloroflexi bacterium]|nr:hypothetical protein [Chloroflexota bacterium]
MTLPSILFGLLLAALYGAAFHLWRGGSLGRLLLYIVLSLLGFLAGHLAGAALGWNFASVGPLHAGMATLGSAVFLFVGHWLSLVEVHRQ